MVDKEQYKNAIKGLRDTVYNNYDQVLGFLQRFYAVNMVNEIIDAKYSYLHEEWEPIMHDFIDKLYEEDAGSKIITNRINELFSKENTRDISNDFIIESLFPEFINGKFNPDTISLERRVIADKLIRKNETFENSSPDFQREFHKMINEPLNRQYHNGIILIHRKDDDREL